VGFDLGGERSIIESMDIKKTLSQKVEVAPARVRLEVQSVIYVGDVYLPDKDFRSRVSDVLNDPERRFLPLLNVDVIDGATAQVVNHWDFLLVRLATIDIVVPLKEPARLEPTSD
jgi:hypothetical protein